ncbi:MAG: OsmC family protein [Bacteroidetes bacterium]|nr:OsmC family protein [Bacteroidota bacterium]
MATIKTVYQGHLRTISTHLASGNELITDAPKDNHGKGEAFSPTDLLSTSLGVCMLTVMGIAAETHQIEMNDISIEITKIMASNPRRVSEIVVVFNFEGKAYSDHDKLILERTARTCPVALSLHPDLKQTISFNWE